MQMPGRKYSATTSAQYRFSINGQEKETEVNENITTATYWEYDSRIGRRWNVDPKPNVSISPYAAFANNPIWFIDVKGDTIELIIGKPYTDVAGIEHPYGHAALRVFNAKEGYNMVYDFGRYGEVDWNKTTGEGILNVYKDGSKYIQSETRVRSSVGYTNASTVNEDRQIIAHFEAQTDAGSVYKTGAVPNGGGTAYKLEKYDVFKNNCLTKSSGGLSLVGMNWLGGEYDPRVALSIMEKLYKPFNLTRTEYNIGELPKVTFTAELIKPMSSKDFKIILPPALKDKTAISKPIQQIIQQKK
jgi:hypothetical protein